PKGVVVFVGLAAFISFLAEGAVMDWSGVFLTTVRGLDISLAGTGFTVFSAAMLTMRLLGDRTVQWLGQRLVVLGGSLLSLAGFILVIVAEGSLPLYAGFFLIGFGGANIVPVFFSILGRQNDMPIGMAVPAVSTMGYLGILMGPAAIGFLAHQTSLYAAFGMLAALMAIQFVIGWHVYRKVIKGQ
ncbi:MAG: MFS transporter, partial [Clostridia bacterium]|nr:MFS transporter [Clostridia bacterium]